jgi:transposase, IS30 family
MSRHQDAYCCHWRERLLPRPHSPWQRGTGENSNGLPRQYLTKITNLSFYNRDELDAMADSLNRRPRATYALYSPFEVFSAATPASASQAQGSKH